MDTEKLQAGRELNALIAEKAMGIDVCKCLKSPWRAWSVEGLACLICGKPIPAEYSTDIAAAMSLMLKFARDGWFVSVLYDPIRGCWRACIESTDKTYPYIDADTAPLAICLAVLQVVEERLGCPTSN